MVEQIKPQDVEMNTERTHLNIQQFMLDMQLVGDQVKDKELVKPTFNYGDISVTNYLLWLILGELMNLNDKIEE